jgi:hypothetical protein
MSQVMIVTRLRKKEHVFSKMKPSILRGGLHGLEYRRVSHVTSRWCKCKCKRRLS